MRLYKIKEKGNKNLLKKYFDKWKDVINKKNVKLLKSKILYKIYEKNNSNLDKDLLNKYFQIWKNKTFLKNLSKYKQDISILTIQQDTTKKLFVKSIVNNLDKKTNKDLLREYFNRWKRLCNLNNSPDIINYKKHILLSKIFENRYNIEYISLLQYLLRWKNKMLEMRAKEAHKPYRKKVIKILLTKNDKV